MNFEQAMMALKAIGSDVYVQMRHPGNWYCSVRGVEVGNGSTLRTPTASSPTPEDAVLAAFTDHTELKHDEYLVLRAMSDQRRCVRWNGFMWADHDVQKAQS